MVRPQHTTIVYDGNELGRKYYMRTSAEDRYDLLLFLLTQWMVTIVRRGGFKKEKHGRPRYKKAYREETYELEFNRCAAAIILGRYECRKVSRHRKWERPQPSPLGRTSWNIPEDEPHNEAVNDDVELQQSVRIFLRI